MSSRRVRRLNEQLKREISRVLRQDVQDPRVREVTVTGVDVTADLEHARVHVRSLDDAREGKEMAPEALEGLRAAAPHIRRELGESLHLRRIPELRFERDTTLEHARRIEELLDEVRPEGGWPEDDA